MKSTLGGLLMASLWLAACAPAQQTPPEDPAAPFPAPVAEPPAEIDLKPTDPEVMNHVFAAELLGSEGDFSGAAAEYLEAALISDDPQIAERATRVAISAGEWQMVALASDRWAMLNPASLEAREMAAGSRLREGDYVGAEYRLAQILELTADSPAHGWKVVTALLAPASDQARANKVLESLLQQFDAGSNADAQFARSQFAARLGDLDQAMELADAAIALAPGRADLLAWSGRIAVNMGRNELALERYRQAWLATPQDLQVAMSYAELLKRQGDAGAGLDVLAQLPDTPEMRFARIVFALDAGDRASAETLYAGFTEQRYSGAEDLPFHAAQSAELLDDPDEAIRWYGKVTGENALRATMRRAFLLAESGDIGSARNLMTQLRIRGDTRVKSQSYQAEAQMLQQAGQPEEAMLLLDAALVELPDEFSLRYGRALLAVSMGRIELAETDLRRAIAEDPDNAVAINALGYTLADLTDRYDEAEELIRLAYELQPDDPSVIDSMGWIAYRQGRLDEAERYLREAWHLLRNPEVAAHLGEVLWVRGYPDEARALWAEGREVEGDQRVLIETMQRFGEQP
ncbi:MAG: tetratricopeptide repeat protein [Lysobacterales bacterium]